MYGDKPLGPFIGRHVTYVLDGNQALQYNVQTTPAGINWVHSDTCVDLTVTLGGQVLNLTNVTQGNAPGNWY